MNDPKEPKDPLLLDHEADGIKELDNNLPRWWVWLFVLCVIHSIGYMFFYHVFHPEKTQASEYALDAAAGEKLKHAVQEKFEASLASLEPSKDPVVLAKGHQVYDLNCAPCHRQDGGGLVGPNLCDDYWIHGPKFSDNLKVIVNGVPVKGMLAWKESLMPEQIHAVASYIYTLRGSKPPNPKLPENEQQPEKPNEFE